MSCPFLSSQPKTCPFLNSTPPSLPLCDLSPSFKSQPSFPSLTPFPF